MNILNRISLIAPLLIVAACESTPPPLGTVEETALQQMYTTAEELLLAHGKMRTETNPSDARFSYADLVRDFGQIALHNEYQVSGGRFIPNKTPTHLRRWQGPVRVATLFGQSNTSREVRRETREVSEFTRRIAELTDLDMATSDATNTNFLVVFLNRAEQVAFAETLPERYPGISNAVIDAFRNSPRNIFCAAFAFTKDGEKGVYDNALILIKSEHSGFMRKSCIHEEMAQAMGLTNDSPDARPSIFNDDEEFAFLTKHDEILLRMLYDPRLKAGMEDYEVTPLLPSIVRDAVGAGI